MTDQKAEAIVIGTSAGGLEALSTILPAFKKDYPLPVLVVIHVPPHKESLMVSLIQQKSPLFVKEAEDKEPIRGGTIYFAPPDYHLQVETNHQLSLSSDELVNYSRPSIDVLFESAADTYGAGLIGVVLTGANHDGALGLQSIHNAGGIALVQDPGTAYSAEMPKAALKACPTAHVMSLQQITTFLNEVVVSL